MKVFVILSLFFAVLGQELEPCEPPLGQFRDDCYRWTNANDYGLVNFWEARRDCIRLGGNLTSAVDSQEAEWLALRHQNAGQRWRINYWIGGTDEPHRNGTYTWVDGKPWSNEVAANHWATGQPSGSPQHCTALWTQEPGFWDDQHCDDANNFFICKFEKRKVCDCGENESKFCDTGYWCTEYRVCESGSVITVQCPTGMVVDPNTIQCRPELEVPPPCGLYRNCSGLSNGGHPIYDDLCRSYYSCTDGQITAETWCEDGLVFDSTTQTCIDPEQVCPPCGTADSTPGGPCPTLNKPTHQ